ncbi:MULTISPECIES: hypothetical protein [Clostridium]|uniref:Uncharacterized protein n=1 Tax=Clostridium frigoriphilum TaxID=443253 RepID=A0ABU7UU78_9CLOT|nr:hypothetical protein [Clostridium sp. DSM 17811]MBU3098725.1 hypothetical protein [Clostridium sp. DSM 17811]
MTKKIFKKSIAIELICNGENLLYTEQNRLKSWLTVFCFEETEELLRKVTEINDRNE